MKSYRNLYPQIYTFSNLIDAWKKARKGKRYTPAAATFERNLDYEIADLHHQLESGTYQPGEYVHFIVHEPKRRLISAAPFRDRVVHHALCNVIEPIYERKFIEDSYANRIDKGTHRALDRCTYFMRRYPYVLQCDIQQFFPAIDHAVLKSILAQPIRDEKVLELSGKIIDSGQGVLTDEYDLRYFAGDDLLAALRPRGLPIGNLTSQFWANVYLNPLDHFIKRVLKCEAYVRYVDDFLLFGNDKKTLHEWQRQIVQFLQSLRLTIHENRAQPCPIEQGIPFLGFTLYTDHRLLKQSKGIAYRRHLHTLRDQYKQGKIVRQKIDASVRAWVGHVMHGDTWGLRTKLFEEMIL